MSMTELIGAPMQAMKYRPMAKIHPADIPTDLHTATPTQDDQRRCMHNYRTRLSSSRSQRRFPELYGKNNKN